MAHFVIRSVCDFPFDCVNKREMPWETTLQCSLISLITHVHNRFSLWSSSWGERIEWTKVIASALLFVSFSFPSPCAPAWLVCPSPSAACPVPSSFGTHPEVSLAPVFGHWGHLPHWCFGTEIYQNQCSLWRHMSHPSHLLRWASLRKVGWKAKASTSQPSIRRQSVKWWAGKACWRKTPSEWQG